MTRLLVIEDNEDLAYGLKNNLEIEGYEVAVAADGRAGLDLAERFAPDLVVLDLMLPEMDGFRVLKALRGSGRDLPVLVLTARGEEADKVRGFKLGADDYVTKPFGLLELLARVEALLRRASGKRAGETGADAVERFGDIEVRSASRVVLRRGEPVELAPKEFDLLMALLRARGAVVPRRELMQHVWGYSEDAVSRTLDTHVGELRRKLEADPTRPRHVLTARKIGYRLRRD